MKYKNLTLFSLLFLVSFAVQAQERFKGAIVFGANLSQIDGDLLAGYNQIGFNVGGEVTTVLNEKWDLSLEMLYSQKGAHRTPDDFQGAPYDNIRLNYVETPVFINFYDWKFRASAGISYARMINYKLVDPFGVDLSDVVDFKPNVFSFILGATYFINEKWGITARWGRESDVRVDENSADFRGKTLTIRGMYRL